MVWPAHKARYGGFEGSMISVGIKLALGTAFAILGCWVVYLAEEMVGIFGEGMGVDEPSRLIYSRAHVAVHLFGTGSASVVGLFLMAKRKWLATFAVGRLDRPR